MGGLYGRNDIGWTKTISEILNKQLFSKCTSFILLFLFLQLVVIQGKRLARSRPFEKNLICSSCDVCKKAIILYKLSVVSRFRESVVIERTFISRDTSVKKIKRLQVVSKRGSL